MANTIVATLNKPVALSGEYNVSIWLNPNDNDATDVSFKLGDIPSQPPSPSIRATA